MLDFTYYAPTKVHFGKGKEQQVGEIVASYGFHTVMLQYGKESIKKSGLYDTVMASLSAAGIRVVEMGGVEPNPKITFVREAAELAKKEGVELILAVGGGSVIDSSKYTALAAANDGDVWDFITRKRTPESALPVGVILTIAAAGSEMSGSAVLSNLELSMKRGLNGDFNRPLFAILNPELTYTVSPYQTACGIVDIMAHTMERYFTDCEPTPLTDRLAESILVSVIEAGKVLMDTPDDYEARATMMWASSLSHNDLTGCGRENALPVHQLEHALSGEFDHIAHGAGLAVLFPAWGRYVLEKNLPRFAQFARRVWGVSEEDDRLAAQAGIEKMAEYFASLGMPQRLSDFDIPKNSLAKLTELCTFGNTRTVKSYVELNQKTIQEIFESCY
ncbi:MAG: iron-containing alcohol dehydrogenase [Clostridia bacterium]|nr:iron-containing alcohol dehydrogenase [Clostridia bacterium]